QRLHDHLTLGADRSADLAEQYGRLARQELRRALDDFPATGARHGEHRRLSAIGGHVPKAGVTDGCSIVFATVGDTCRRPESPTVAKTMLLVEPQLAPTRPRAAHSVCGRPP